MIVAMLAATVLLADSTTAAAPQPTPAQTAAAAQVAKKKDDPNKLVCKSEPVLGSRMPTKRCTTAEQAAFDKAEAREELEKAQVHR